MPFALSALLLAEPCQLLPLLTLAGSNFRRMPPSGAGVEASSERCQTGHPAATTTVQTNAAFRTVRQATSAIDFCLERLASRALTGRQSDLFQRYLLRCTYATRRCVAAPYLERSQRFLTRRADRCGGTRDDDRNCIWIAVQTFHDASQPAVADIRRGSFASLRIYGRLSSR